MLFDDFQDRLTMLFSCCMLDLVEVFDLLVGHGYLLFFLRGGHFEDVGAGIETSQRYQGE